MGSHARFLQLQGQSEKDVDAIAGGSAERAQVTEKERALLDYVKVLTLEPARVRDADVARLRTAGWTDEQIFEASFITSLFAFFNRMADAYGLDYPANGWMPEEIRATRSAPEKGAGGPGAARPQPKSP